MSALPPEQEPEWNFKDKNRLKKRSFWFRIYMWCLAGMVLTFTPVTLPFFVVATGGALTAGYKLANLDE